MRLQFAPGMLLSLSLLVLLTTGCSHMFSVKSDPPQADVYYESPGTRQKKALGKTPLEMAMGEVKEKAGDANGAGEFLTIIVEKPGYDSETLLVPATRFGTLVTNVDVKLKKDNSGLEEKTAKTIINRLFLAQKLALTQQFERAQIEIDKILTDFPTFSRALSMRASIYFAQKNLIESLKWYEEALKADPQMEEAVRMTAKIRSLQSGERAPSSSTSQLSTPTSNPATDKKAKP